MTASVREPGSARTAVGALFALAALACGTPGVVPTGSPLEPPASLAAHVPAPVERAAGDVAAAVLARRGPAAAAAVGRVEALERARLERGEAPSGLVPFAHFAHNATVRDRVAYRTATLELLESDDLDPGLEKLLAEDLADDPLRLADARLADARRTRFTRTFNTLAAPVGRSILTAALAPLRLARALVALAVQQRMEDPISVPERQALAHWRRYLDAHPERATPEMLSRVDALQDRWLRMKRKRRVAAARRALDLDQPELAFVLAERALRYIPEDDEAETLRNRAAEEVLRRREERRRSLQASSRAAADATRPGRRALAVALLLPDADLEGALRGASSSGPDETLEEVTRFVAAGAQGRAGHEDAMWDAYRTLADADPEHSSVARHAGALVGSPTQNPHEAFEAARRADERARGAWVAFGPLARGPRDMQLPDPLEWLIEAPTFLEALAGMPNRLLQAPWAPPTATVASNHAHRYLKRFPDGEHVDAVRAWLIDFERERGNAIEAHRLAATDPGVDPERLDGLAEDAARQALRSAREQSRLDARLALLRHAAREYPETDAGREAGRLARREAQAATAQRIRISRAFLRENPSLTGPAGLGLQPELLDGAREDGELHPDGITLLGGRTLEFAFIDESGDPERPPRRVRREVSEERLARVVALLDEAAMRQALVDPDVEIEPDADRDLFFERARLGAVDRPDARPTARSEYVFLSARERYGMVRKRESILPVELVLQGSFEDLGLGAFPRLHAPRPTPDAILYR